MKKNRKLIYLASPYAHKDWQVILDRFKKATVAAGNILKTEDVYVFSPIIHSHILALYNDFPKTDFKFWREYDFELLSRCDELWVLKLEGWEKSIGVSAEIEYAKQHNIPIKYLDLDKYIVDNDLSVVIVAGQLYYVNAKYTYIHRR